MLISVMAPSRKANSTSVRTTFVLPETLNKNLEVLSPKMGETKSNIVRRALSSYLEAQRLDPSSVPQIAISYGSGGNR